jgi:SAM-dependent methyltransferase
MAQVNLLRKLPVTKRNTALLTERNRVKKFGEHNAISRLFGFDYFDGHRKYGYGGYRYDGRWIPVAKDIIEHYKLNPGARVLDIGCAKGFLVHALYNQGVQAFGVDISRYALKHCPTDIIGRVNYGDILDLCYPDDSFDLVLCINVIHNLPKGLIHLGFKEVQRVSKKYCFITVDSYYTEEQRKEFESWCLTAKTHMYPEEWVETFKQHDYIGDYWFTTHQFGDLNDQK